MDQSTDSYFDIIMSHYNDIYIYIDGYRVLSQVFVWVCFYY